MRPCVEIASLLVLIDDPDSVVRDAVYNRLYELGEDAISTLKQMDDDYSPNLSISKKDLSDLIEHLRVEFLIRRIERIVQNSDSFIGDELLTISSLVDLNMDFVTIESIVCDMRNEIISELSDENTIIERVKIFNYIFYFRFGFRYERGYILKYEDVAISHALSLKSGSLYVIMVLYIMFCRYCGLPVYPHIVGDGIYIAYLKDDDTVLFFLDISKEGEIVRNEGVVKIDRGDSDRLLVKSYLENLRLCANSANDLYRVKLIDRVSEIVSSSV